MSFDRDTSSADNNKDNGLDGASDYHKILQKKKKIKFNLNFSFSYTRDEI